MQSIKLVVVGDPTSCRPDSGASNIKTIFLVTYTTNKYPLLGYVPAAFDNTSLTVTLGSNSYSLSLWDSSGSEYLAKRRSLIYSQTDVFLVCFSVASRRAFENVKELWVPEITHHYPKTPFLLVGLETELRDDSVFIERMKNVKQSPVTVEEGEELAHELKAAKYIECSPYTKKGLKEVFEEAILASIATPRKGGRFHIPKISFSSLFRSVSGGAGHQPKKEVQSPKHGTIEVNTPEIQQVDGDKGPAPLSEKSIEQPKEGKVYTIEVKQLELQDMIGQGGFGAVFRGKWKARKGEVVAVKKCPMGGTKVNPDTPREVEILSCLPEHPNIISFYAIAFNFPDMFIVTAFAEKGSLFDYLHKDKQVPTIDQSLAWALQVAQGMEHLHNHDIIHRDLKSPNVLLSSEMTAKVCDFGTARYLSHTTKQTGIAGTPRWMAPEVMEAVEAKINKKCDSFSYGMIVYELLVHKVLYHDIPGDSVVCMKVLQGKRPTIPPSVPEYLRFLLKACWEADSHKRPTFQDITKWLHSRTVQTIAVQSTIKSTSV